MYRNLRPGHLETTGDKLNSFLSPFGPKQVDSNKINWISSHCMDLISFLGFFMDCVFYRYDFIHWVSAKVIKNYDVIFFFPLWRRHIVTKTSAHGNKPVLYICHSQVLILFCKLCLPKCISTWVGWPQLFYWTTSRQIMSCMLHCLIFETHEY